MEERFYKDKEEEKRAKRKRIILIIIAILVVYVILNLIKVEFLSEESFIEEVPYEASVTGKVVADYKTVEECEEREFEFESQWEDWQPEENGYVSPTLRIFNLEDRKGTFKIAFGFFDDAVYPYDSYVGINYEDIKEELPWDDATSMISDKISVEFGPDQDKPIFIYTKKKDDKLYWAYADIDAPTYVYCTPKRVYQDITKESENVTKYRNETKWTNETNRKTLWQVLMEKFK